MKGATLLNEMLEKLSIPTNKNEICKRRPERDLALAQLLDGRPAGFKLLSFSNC